MRDVLSTQAVSVSQYTALSMIESHAQMPNARLAERVMVSPQAANALIKSMQGQGWIERKPDPKHGRVINIRLTAHGRRVLSRCDAEIADLEQTMLGGIPESERRHLRATMRSLLRQLHTMQIGVERGT